MPKEVYILYSKYWTVPYWVNSDSFPLVIVKICPKDHSNAIGSKATPGHVIIVFIVSRTARGQSTRKYRLAFLAKNPSNKTYSSVEERGSSWIWVITIVATQDATTQRAKKNVIADILKRKTSIKYILSTWPNIMGIILLEPPHGVQQEWSNYKDLHICCQIPRMTHALKRIFKKV